MECVCDIKTRHKKRAPSKARRDSWKLRLGSRNDKVAESWRRKQECAKGRAADGEAAAKAEHRLLGTSI